MNMKCPACGGVELVRDTRDMAYSYKDKGETTMHIDMYLKAA